MTLVVTAPQLEIGTGVPDGVGQFWGPWVGAGVRVGVGVTVGVRVGPQKLVSTQTPPNGEPLQQSLQQLGFQVVTTAPFEHAELSETQAAEVSWARLFGGQVKRNTFARTRWKLAEIRI